MIRFDVHVHPGSRQRTVRGSYAGALDVHVHARAVDGAATKEVLLALAKAFNVPASAVQCVKGVTSRQKTITLDGDDESLTKRLVELLSN